MAEKLTPQQRLAVENRGGKLLVSAAAGSGKTKVLVDRLMGYILDPVTPANIDDFLIITYTKAAAGELRGKIAAKLSQQIALTPSNRHLQQQMQRLYLARISTVHGFCTDVLRQYAYRLGIPADFRVADEGECLQLQLKALESVLNSAYETADTDPDFCSFVDTQGLGRDDRQIPEIVLKVYNSARCHLNPNQWLDWCMTGQTATNDAGQTPWGQYLIDDLHQYVAQQVQALENCISAGAAASDIEKPIALFQSTISQLKVLLTCESWDEIVENQAIDYGRLAFSKKCTDLQLIEKMKAVRNACKEGMAKRLRNFTDKSTQIFEDIDVSLGAARGLVSLVYDFTKEYDRLKRNRGVLDFGDLEHKALDLLLGKRRSSVTAIAAELGDQFREVMVDEYQDSNEIQDAIFGALTEKRQNCFMVGDVKQSIYQFRLADPGIFIKKYNTYESAESAVSGQGRKVLLSHNFRSSNGVISAVNDVFGQCMSTQVGGLIYGEAEMLREGIAHIPLKEPEVSLYGIDVESDTYGEEAAFVADKICDLLDGRHFVRDGDNLRPVRPEDIVILLRSPGSVGGEFQFALQQRGVRCSTSDTVDLLATKEIAAVSAILEIIHNPLQDIPLVAAMTGPVFGYTAQELAELKSTNRNASIYALLCGSDNEKNRRFLQTLNELRSAAKMMSVAQLLNEIYKKTDILSIYSSMPDGQLRLENLQNFFQMVSDYENSGPKELGRFLEYLNTAKEHGLMGQVATQDNGSVTIMSIHKSKGLEFPVVFLCGLSRGFNQESVRAQVLCDKDLGLGLGCTDTRLRVRYPTLAKRAISAKITREGISEEMRVLYVAMTRARDRLIMTYAVKNLQSDLQDMAMRLDMSSGALLSGEADCPGAWILQAALTRTEAGAFFALSGHPDCACVRDTVWQIQVVQSGEHSSVVPAENKADPAASQGLLNRLADGLSFCYKHFGATRIPSKLTATQLKGRSLDTEIAEGTDSIKTGEFRSPGSSVKNRGKLYGNATHTAMQYIRFSACDSVDSIHCEIARLEKEQFLSREQAEMLDCEKLFTFFDTPMGRKLRESKEVLREFKFSILDDASKYYPDASGEQVLLQGIVDCALIEEDGITILDFKTDYVTEDTVAAVGEKYRSQVMVYADALSRIYQRPVKSVALYFFSINRYFDVI